MKGFLPLWLAAVLLPLLAFAGGAWWSWHQVQAEAGARLLRTAQMLEVNALRTFEAHEAVLTAIERAIRGMGWEEIASSSEVHGLLRGLEGSATALDGIGLVRPDGLMVAVASRFPFEPIDVSDREYVRGHRDPATFAGIGEALFSTRSGSLVGQVVVSRPREVPVFSLSRRRSRPADGGFDGVVVTAFAPDYFADLYARVSESSGDSVSLFRLDGALLARQPPVADWTRRLPSDAAVLRFAAAPEGQGLATIRSVLDGVERLVAVRRLEGYPVAIAYGLDLAVARQAWLRQLANIGLRTSARSRRSPPCCCSRSPRTPPPRRAAPRPRRSAHGPRRSAGQRRRPPSAARSGSRRWGRSPPASPTIFETPSKPSRAAQG
jgi:two-component system, NtrC family, sensor kinase